VRKDATTTLKPSAMAKLFVRNRGVGAATKVVQIYCPTATYTIFRSSYFRDAKVTEIYEGTSEIQRLVISQSELLKDEGA